MEMTVKELCKNCETTNQLINILCVYEKATGKNFKKRIDEIEYAKLKDWAKINLNGIFPYNRFEEKEDASKDDWFSRVIYNGLHDLGLID